MPQFAPDFPRFCRHIFGEPRGQVRVPCLYFFAYKQQVFFMLCGSGENVIIPTI